MRNRGHPLLGALSLAGCSSYSSPFFLVAELIPPCILRKYARGYVTKRSREPPMYPVSPPHSATAFNKSFSVAQEKPNMSEDCRTIYLVETPKQQ